MGRSYKAAVRELKDDPVAFDVERIDDKGDVVVDKFTCRGKVSTLLLSEFAVQSDVSAATPEGMALIARFFRQAFGDEKEYGRFFRYATEHLDDEGLMAILGGLVEDFSGRPTKGRQRSPGGRSKSGRTSKGASSMTVVGEVSSA